MATADPKRDFLRHTLATLAYRGGKAVRLAPAEFADFQGAGRPPAQILAHVGDLLDWSLSIAQGKPKFVPSQPLTWDKEINRFFSALRSFDDYLASGEPVHAPIEKLFQGPIADALTHVGADCHASTHGWRSHLRRKLFRGRYGSRPRRRRTGRT